MGRGTAGVKGMNVADKGNEVLSLDVVDASGHEGGAPAWSPRTATASGPLISEYPIKGRGGKGVLTAKLTAKKGGLAGARVVREGQELIFISQTGMVQRNAVAGISRMGRPTQGVRVMNLKKGDRVSAVALVVESEANGNGNGAAATDAPVEEEAPTLETVAEEAAAAEAAGNGEAKVTKTLRLERNSSQGQAEAGAKRRQSAKPKARRRPPSRRQNPHRRSGAPEGAPRPQGRSRRSPR